MSCDFVLRRRDTDFLMLAEEEVGVASGVVVVERLERLRELRRHLEGLMGGREGEEKTRE